MNLKEKGDIKPAINWGRPENITYDKCASKITGRVNFVLNKKIGGCLSNSPNLQGWRRSILDCTDCFSTYTEQSPHCHCKASMKFALEIFSSTEKLVKREMVTLKRWSIENWFSSSTFVAV
jgi:hypothetical protein